MIDATTKTQIESRLKRVAGQVGGIQRMVADERYCIDILSQIAAARAALAKAGRVLLEAHIETCVVGAFESKNARDQAEKIAELISVFDKNCNY